MPAQIGDWLADLRGTEPIAAAEVGATLIALLATDQVTNLPLVTHADGIADVDPREVLDYSYQRQLEELQKVRRQFADMATHRAAAEEQLAALRERPDQDAQALEGLERQAADARQEEARLRSRSQQLQARVDAFRTRKETIKASYTAAEAQARIADAFEELQRLQHQSEHLVQEGRVKQAADGPGRADKQHEHDEAVPDQPGGNPEGDTGEHAETIVRYQPHSADQAEDAPKSDRAGTAEASGHVGEPRHPEPAGPNDRRRRAAGAARRPRMAAHSDVLELTADPLGMDIRIHFAIEPANTITLLTALEGRDAVLENGSEALDVAGELLDEIRAQGTSAESEADDDWLEFAGSSPFLDRFFADESDVIANRARELGTLTTLAKLRHRRGMSLKDLARSTGIDEHRLAAIERGGPAQSDLHELAAIVRQLGDRLELMVMVDGERHRLG